MKRAMMGAYVRKSDKAAETYQKAFNAKIVSSYLNEDGTYFHCELDVYGQILAIAERNETLYSKDEETNTGNVMQFCLHFKEEESDLVHKAYDVLSEDAQILYPLGECEFSKIMVDLIDKYGVRWCIFA